MAGWPVEYRSGTSVYIASCMSFAGGPISSMETVVGGIMLPTLDTGTSAIEVVVAGREGEELDLGRGGAAMGAYSAVAEAVSRKESRLAER
jgi:hypothetical protein